eukprot:1050450-Pyramimonas_sp.AAC.1
MTRGTSDSEKTSPTSHFAGRGQLVGIRVGGIAPWTTLKANHHAALKPFEANACPGYRELALACNRELAQAVQFTPRMQSLIVGSVLFAKSLYARGNKPLPTGAAHLPRLSTVLGSISMTLRYHG